MRNGLTSMVLGLALAIALRSAFGQSVDLSVTPINGIGVVTPTLTWTTVSVTGCTATGGWTGSKATSGSQVQPSIVTTTTYTLTCSGPGPGSAQLTWTPPTTNTDGSTLTNLAGYKVYWGTSQGALSSSVTLNNPGLMAYTVDNLSSGTYYFGVTAFNAAAIESVLSNIASKQVTATTTVSDSVTVAVTPAPNPPGSLTVVSSVAMETRTKRGRLVVWREAGSIEPGTACDPSVRIGDTEYYGIAPSAVTPIRKQDLSDIVVALCREALSVG